MVTYRRPKNGPLYICKLLTIPNVQQGIPGLTYKHILFDSMHVLESGVLHYWNGLTLYRLVKRHFFGNVDDSEVIDLAADASIKKYLPK